MQLQQRLLYTLCWCHEVVSSATSTKIDSVTTEILHMGKLCLHLCLSTSQWQSSIDLTLYLMVAPRKQVDAESIVAPRKQVDAKPIVAPRKQVDAKRKVLQ